MLKYIGDDGLDDGELEARKVMGESTQIRTYINHVEIKVSA